MIWDYQRHALFTVIWHGRIEIEPGQLIKVTGYFSSPGRQTQITAKAIIERDGTVHEQPDPPSADILLQEIYPVEGRVYDCAPRGDVTIIGLYQTIPNLFSFPNLSHHRAFLVLPEFWNFLEERDEYEDLVFPHYRQLQDIREESFEFPDVRDSTWAIYRFGILSGIFGQEFVQVTCGKIRAKIGQLWRLRKRAAFGNRMKLHLLVLGVSDGRSYLLDELVHEGPMTLEHAAFVAYSVLDLCALIVNRTLQLGIPDKKTSFTAVLGKNSDEETVSNLGQSYPNLPLTKYWLEQQSSWIARVRDLRHYFAHEGTAIQIYGPNERLLSAAFDNSVEEPNQIFDVENEVADWLNKTAAFYSTTLDLLAEHCILAVKPFESEPVKRSIRASTVASKLDGAFQEVLKLLLERDENNPDRVMHLYARLEKGWRNRWPLSKFTAFLASWDAVALKPSTISAGTDGNIVNMSGTIIYKIEQGSFSWPFRLEKSKQERPVLIGDALTRPTSPQSQTTITNYDARQSGRETGHSCAEFRFLISNSGEDVLTEIEAIVMKDGLEAARSTVGTLASGESRPVHAITTPELGTLLPPGGPYMFETLINEPVMVRIVYRLETKFGDEWADEHPCANVRPRP